MREKCKNKSAGNNIGLPVCEVCQAALAGFEIKDTKGNIKQVCGKCVDRPGMSHVRVLNDFADKVLA